MRACRWTRRGSVRLRSSLPKKRPNLPRTSMCKCQGPGNSGSRGLKRSISAVFLTFAAWRRTPMSTISKWGSLVVLGICLVIVFATGTAVWPQASTINFTVTGQSMIRSDFRAHAPDEVATISPLLTGDVKFTNFEATVIEKESTHDGRFLSPPEALDALQALGFNLLALSDNHSFDLKVAGVQNTLS